MKTYKTPIMKPVELKTACIIATSPSEPAVQSIDTYTESDESNNNNWSIN